MVAIAFNLATTLTVAIGFVSAIALPALAVSQHLTFHNIYPKVYTPSIKEHDRGLSPDKKT